MIPSVGMEARLVLILTPILIFLQNLNLNVSQKEQATSELGIILHFRGLLFYFPPVGRRKSMLAEKEKKNAFLILFVKKHSHSTT
jgi:hypothetical protein